MTDLSNKILDKIKKNHVTPKPRWYFMLMKTLLLGAIIISVIFGSLAIAIVIRHFNSTSWNIAQQLMGSRLRSFFTLVPYLWLIFIGVTLLIADRLFFYTKKGHRYHPWLITVISIVLSLNFGFIFYAAELDTPIESGLMNNVELYKRLETKRYQLFTSPEKGVLVGEVQGVSDENIITIKDYSGKEWQVEIEEVEPLRYFRPKPGITVGVTGERLDEDRFKSRYIGSWRDGRNSYQFYEIRKTERKY